MSKNAGASVGLSFLASVFINRRIFQRYLELLGDYALSVVTVYITNFVIPFGYIHKYIPH